MKNEGERDGCNIKNGVDTVIQDRVREEKEYVKRKGHLKVSWRTGERENVARRMAGVQLKELRPIK